MRKIIVRGPALSRSGYGEQTRFALRSLRAYEDEFDIFLVNTNWGHTGWDWEDTEERRWVDEVITKTHVYMQGGGGFDMSLQITIPNEWERLAPINIGYTAGIETTKVSPQWIEKSMLMDRIIVVSNHAKEVYLGTTYEAQNKETGELNKDFRCKTPIEVVNYPVRNYESVDLDIELEHDFNFLVVAQMSPRKNLEKTIRWIMEEFYDQEIGLVLKCNIKTDCIFDRTEFTNSLRRLLSEYKDRKCSVYLLHGAMKAEEINSLYQHPKIKALVSLTHGEGFGLPLFEAAYNGLPVITSPWSGHCDFLFVPTKDKNGKEKKRACFAKVNYVLKPVQKEAVWDGVVQKDSMWCYPEQGSFKMKARKLYKEYHIFKKLAKKLQKWVLKEFTEEKQYKKFVDFVRGEDTVSQEDINEWFNRVSAS